MKFVCENCKAKYQIGDDKVSGKTVRMKCRRCGHLILVSSAVTESSVARGNPAEGAPLGPGLTPVPAPSTVPPPRAGFPAAPTAPRLPAIDDDDDDDDGDTKIMRTPPAPVRPAPPARPTTGGLRAPMAPRPGAPLAPQVPVPQPSAPGVAASAVAPAARPVPPKPHVPPQRIGTGGFVPAASPSAPSLGDLAQRSMSNAISAAARGTSNPAGPSRSATGGNPFGGGMGLGPSPAAAATGHPAAGAGPGGVAGAFQRSVVGTQPVLRADTPAEDWYVGVGGVPIGPVRLSVIREKVEQGAVDGESLVWREGFDEWQPLKNVPGLRAILDDGRRVSTPEGARLGSSSTNLPRISHHTPPPGHLVAPLGPPPAAPVANGANGHGALGLGNVPTGGVSLGPAATAPAPQVAPADERPPVAQPDLLRSPSAAPSPYAQPSTGSLPPPSVEPRRRGMHPFAYAMIAMAAVFGGVAAWVLLTREPPKVIVVTTAAPTSPGLAAPPPPPTAEGEASTEPVASVDPRTGEKPVALGGPIRPPPTASAKGPDGAPLPNAGSFDTGPSGPNGGPATTGPSSAKGQLTEGEINGVVTRNMASVRRRCWQPALDARSANAPKSARVGTSITISPAGSVSAASASGSEQHYPGLSACIGSAIRGWVFPPSEGSTTVNIPFSFNAQ